MNRHPQDPKMEDEDHKYNRFLERLKQEITFIFVQKVKPLSVMHVIPLIDPNVLNQIDRQRVHACQAANGDGSAAGLLLDCLVVYKNWFDCLLNVLKHHDVKLTHVAENFEKMHEKIYKEFYPNQPTTIQCDSLEQKSSNELRRQTPRLDAERKSPGTPSADPLSTFNLTDGPSTNFEDDGLDCDSSLPTLEQQAEPIGKPQQNISKMGKPLPKKTPEMPVHGPEYDFTYEETSSALKTFHGWCEETDEIKIKGCLEKFCHEDGHFIFWFWAKKKRPGVCIIFQKKIRSFVVHKRPAKGDKPTHFYIERDGMSYPKLKDLLTHHLDQGIRGMSLIHPVVEST